MELKKAEKLARTLMYEHELLGKGWQFKFDRSVRRFGCCFYGRKVISMSTKLTLLNDEEKVKDTILHEIAHAIAGHKAGHGPEWKKVCVRIGAKPERCYSSNDTETPTLKYVAVCGACGMVHQKARIKHKHVRRSCICQKGKDWNDRVLLEFKTNH